MNNRIKWILFCLAFTLSALLFGLMFAFGALFSEVLETFDTDRSTAATVQSLLIGIALCFGVVNGILIDKFGVHIVTLMSSVFASTGFAASYFITDVRYLYVTISLLAGVGMSMIYLSSAKLISIIFSGKQKSLCLAIHSVSVPLSGIFYPYLLDLLVTAYGLSGTFLVLSGVFCNTFVFSLLIWLRRCDFTPNRENAQDENKVSFISCQTETQSTTYRMLNYIKQVMSKRYVCLLVAVGTAAAAVNGYLEFAFDIAVWKGFDELQVKTPFVMYNICACIFCVMPGLMKQKLDIDIFFYPAGFALFGLFGSLMTLWSDTYAIYVVGAAFLGAMLGMISSAFIICADLMRLDQVGVAIGMLQTVVGILSAGTGPLFGTIRDTSGSYSLILNIIVAAQAIAAFLFISDIILRRKRESFTLIDNIETQK